jgi:hydrogenase expression/formation protein
LKFVSIFEILYSYLSIIFLIFLRRNKKLDLEEFARDSHKQGISRKQIKAELLLLTGSEDEADAIIKEIENTESIPEGFVGYVCDFTKTGYSAGTSGLGCRGEGDFIVHRTLADIIGATSAVVDAREQDDAGIVAADSGYISAAVDGMHSRLSHFPFLAGFHAARAAVRDVIVMGATPVAMLSDIHIANDGDVGKIMDYTAGASAVADLLGVPLIGGSTLRIGGDLVRGDRLTGCIAAIGTSKKQTARHNTVAGDELIMTEGCGGGTITTTALYHGYHNVLLETLNVKTILVGMKLNRSELLDKIHSMTDITNGGIRGDAREFGATAEVKVIISEKKVRELISAGVLAMLDELEIDPLGISTDAQLFSIAPEHSDELIGFLEANGLSAHRIGRTEEGSGVYIDDTAGDGSEALESTGLAKLEPRSREAPYTPIKDVVDRNNIDTDGLQVALDEAKVSAKDKKAKIIEWINSNREK